jgi:hypothetical protein
MKINDRRVATRTVVEAARESLVIGAGENEVVTFESGVKEPPDNSECHNQAKPHEEKRRFLSLFV